jgi:tellurite resistance protein
VAWTSANQNIGAWAAIGISLWILTALVWLAFSTAWLWGALARHRLSDDLHHPLLGPFVALVPVVAILLGGETARYAPTAGRILVLSSVSVLGILSAWSLASVLTGGVKARVFHAGYFLFILAGALIGAIGFAQIGAREAALVAFTIGVFFWAVLAAVVLARLAALPDLPDAYLPTVAIFSVPPSVAGLGWFAIHGTGLDWVQESLLTLTVFLLVSQGFLVRRYARLPFSLAFWSFTFTAAAPASYGMAWLRAAAVPGWQAWSWLILATVTAWIGWIAARSIALQVHPGSGMRTTRRAAGHGPAATQPGAGTLLPEELP